MQNFSTLINYLECKKHIFIQGHNFPDHDAVATSYALKELLSSFGFESIIVYDGEITRPSVLRMIKEFEIKVHHISEVKINKDDAVIIVDACVGNRNVTNIGGELVAVIDHHKVKVPYKIMFTDIRPEYGACSTILFEYFTELDIEIPENVATALMTGINIDTMQLTRSVTEKDMIAYSTLFNYADMEMVNSIIRNGMVLEDLPFFKYLLDNFKIEESILFCYMKNGCGPNLLGMLADFALGLDETDFVILCARHDNTIIFSIRSENPLWNAAETIEKVLEGTGSGGGHTELAGGYIPNAGNFDPEEIFIKIKELLLA